MFTKHMKLNSTANLFIGISLCALGCLSIFLLSEKFEDSASQPPIRTLIVTIDAHQREELFEQLRKFAEKHAFSYSLTDYGGQGKYFLVEIRGDDIKILANDVSRDLTVFDISFFALSPGDPVPDIQVVDNLMVDLKIFISEIPNVIITEK